MAAKTHISAEYARQLLQYDSVTGDLTWKFRTPDMFEGSGGRYTSESVCKTWNKRFAEKPAGWKKPSGYMMVCFERAQVRAHHLVWLICRGQWAYDQLDHINGCRHDNRIENLREASNAQNRQNMTKTVRNTSGYLGVSWSIPAKKWVARINHGGRYEHLGVFENRESAYQAYLAAKAKYHDFQPEPRE